MPSKNNFVDPVARLSREGARAHAAALAYFELGPKRSIAAVAQRFTKSPRLLKRWSAQHSWVTRAVAYDAELASLQRREIQRQAVAVGEEWAEREREIRERRYQLALRMLERAERMLDFPLTTTERKTRADGTKVLIRKPAGWNFNTTRLLAETGCKLAIDAIRNEAGRDEATENGAVYEFLTHDFGDSG